MYTIFANDTCIYNDLFSIEQTTVIAPKLIVEDSSAGSLSITLTKKNYGYDLIERLVTDIIVKKNDEEIWMGRVLSESKDFWNNRVLHCEGALAFFNDSIQPPQKYSGYSVRGYIEALINVHNSKVSDNRKIYIGAVTVSDEATPDYFTNHEKTIESLNNLLERYGGHIRIRRENGKNYIDYLKDYPNICTQTIQMGVNLLDFTRSWDMSEYATAILPLGARLDSSEVEELDSYLTVESVNDGSPYVESTSAIETYGWIEKKITWPDENDPDQLLKKAKEYLNEIQFDSMQIDLSAIDMSYFNVNVEDVKLLDEIRVISYPHGLNRLFPVTKLEIPLDSPENATFSLGGTIKTSFTSVNSQNNAYILNKIENLPKAHNILKEAKENASAIMNLATTGYITIAKDNYGSKALYFSNNQDYLSSDKFWKWDLNGLGYSNDSGKTYSVAVTMDGSIVADFITAGILNGNIIRTGVIKDVKGNVEFDLEAGSFVMKKGSIQLGSYSDVSKHYKFEVDNDGNLYAGSGIFGGTLAGAKGTFGGELIAASGSFTGTVKAEDFLDRNGNSMLYNGKFSSDYLELRGLSITNGVNETLKVSDTGDVEINGRITMTSGSSIDWLNVNNKNITSNPAYNLASLASDGANLALSTAKTAYDNMCTDNNIFNVLTNSGKKFGFFSDSSNKLYINAEYIKAGTIDANVISLSGSYGGFRQGTGFDGIYNTKGAVIYGSGNPYIIVTDKGCRIEGTSANFYVTGGVYSSEEIVVKSDLRIKNSIDFNLDAYTSFFMKLKPAKFKYNSGTSNRTHIGFIAQDIEKALIDAGLSSIDLAALVKEPVKEVIDEIADYRYGIRYGELIALNTYMIQKIYQAIDGIQLKGGE